MKYRVKNKLGKIIFKIWKWFAPTMSERYQHFDTRMFLKNEMCKDFEWKKYVGKYNPYFKQWGFDVPQYESEYYSKVSGIKADYYVNRLLVFHYI